MVKNSYLTVFIFFGLFLAAMAIHAGTINLTVQRNIVRLQRIEDQLNARLEDRWRLSDAQTIWTELFENNPDLMPPSNLDKLLKRAIKEEPIKLLPLELQ